jgi:hypothetical protein
LNHAFSRSFSKLDSFGFIYINGSYIWKSDLSWDLILNVFNSKPVTSSDKCTWNIIIPGGAKTALHYIFLVVIHQPRASFFPAFLSWKRKKYWFKSLIWSRPGFEPTMDYIEGDHANNHTTGVVQMFVVSFFKIC